MEFVQFIVLAIVGFFIFLQLYSWLSSKRRTGDQIPPFSGEIGEKIQAGDKLLLYFYSPACGACKTMTPLIDAMRNKKNNIYKINLAEDKELGKIFRIMGTPATVIVDNSKIKKFVLGARSKNFLSGLPI